MKKRFSHLTAKSKSEQEDLAMHEYMFLMSAYDYVEDQTSCIASASEVKERLLLSMGKHFALLRRLKK